MDRLRITVMPFIGKITSERLDSFRACHAIQERKLTRVSQSPKDFDAKLCALVKELLLADRYACTVDQEFQVVVQIKVED